MRKNIIIAAIAAASAVLLTVSCAKQEQPGLSNEVKTFTAVIDQGITKTTIDDYKVKWVSGDEISIDGAVYSATPDGTDATKASFAYKSGTTPSAPYSAIYPASLYNAGSLEFPEVQTYEAGKFNAPMYAKSATESLSFKNICGVICFGLKGTSKVKSIAITANEAICGAFTMTDATTVSLTGTGKTVTLDCGDGVQLGTESTNFYIYLPPKTYSAGMKIVITDTDGGTFTQSTASEVIIKRNELYTLVWKTSFTPAGALSGKFSVSASKQIQFSKGNLYYDGSNFNFEANQYGFNSSYQSTYVSHFYWSKTASVAYAKDYSETGTSGDDVFFTNVDGFKVNVGGKDQTGWRTLSTNEWQYLFNTRENANTKYGFATVGDVTGIILLPDTFTDPMKNGGSGAFVPKSTTGWTANTYTTGGNWEAMESAGAVFLPAAGGRLGSNVSSVGDGGVYWSSTAYVEYSAYYVGFNSSNVYPDYDDYRNRGYSVRLITESN